MTQTTIQRLLLAAACLSVAGVASAAAGLDCAPLGELPGFAPADAAAPTRYAYESHEFDVTGNGDEYRSEHVAGRYCQQSYVLGDGKQPMSDLEIQMNYRTALGKLGATIVHTDDSHTFAKIVRDGHETWIEVGSEEASYYVVVVNKQSHQQVLLPPSGNDYKLLGHMPNYVAGTPEKRNFDQLTFAVDDGNGSYNDVNVQGAKFTLNYSLADGAPAASTFDIQANYRTALKQLGAQILHADDSNVFARLESDHQPVWIRVACQTTSIDVYVIEEKSFEASIKPPKVSDLKTALDTHGKVALHVNFDFNKATLRADANPIIAEVVALMKGDPALKLAVEGHTDNVGSGDYNRKLSAQRAASVVAAIIAGGIDAARLTSSGRGADQPIADNATSAGRAENRRVELVKR